MSMEESISLEETNRIRISIGLKPITDDSNPVDDEEKQAEDNYAKRREHEAKERETKSVWKSFPRPTRSTHTILLYREIADRIAK